MARLTAQQVQQKHARNLKNSTQYITDAVNAVTTAPGVQAAKKQDKMLAGVQAAVQSGKWAQRVSSVSLEDWKSKMVNKGIPRISAGIDEAAPKTIAFFEQLLPYQDAVKAKIAAMPDLTLDDNLNRMLTNARAMAQFKRK